MRTVPIRKDSNSNLVSDSASTDIASDFNPLFAPTRVRGKGTPLFCADLAAADYGTGPVSMLVAELGALKAWLPRCWICDHSIADTFSASG
jgi:hypothetical protein